MLSIRIHEPLSKCMCVLQQRKKLRQQPKQPEDYIHSHWNDARQSSDGLSQVHMQDISDYFVKEKLLCYYCFKVTFGKVTPWKQGNVYFGMEWRSYLWQEVTLLIYIWNAPLTLHHICAINNGIVIMDNAIFC